MLEVSDPWGQFNTVSDPHHEYRRLGKPDVKVIHIWLGQTLTKSNYQDMQRFMPVDLAIFSDGRSTLPALTEAVKAATSIARRAALAGRTDKLRNEHQRMKERARNSGQPGLGCDPGDDRAARRRDVECDQNREVVVRRSQQDWARSLWPASDYNDFNGGSGGSGVGYTAPAAVGAALAQSRP